MNLSRYKKSSVQKQADFFNALGSDYIKTVAREYAAIYARTFNAINGHVKGDILDIGSGGITLFKSCGNHVFYDISPVLLSAHSSWGGSSSLSVCGESTSLPFISNSFDTILFHFSIHHFAQETFIKTLNYIKKSIEEAKRVLRPGGKIIIAENTVAEVVELVESLLFPVVSKSLEILNYPPVFLFSEKRLASILKAVGCHIHIVCSFKEPSKLLVSPLKNMRLLLNPVTIKVLVAGNV
ncbi:MAG: class I SAM-dependent methyltransferase [Desulfamplus sp.]|nr:class I SAM-dependent methyltransferase [Desulfamplus sp.]